MTKKTTDLITHVSMVISSKKVGEKVSTNITKPPSYLHENVTQNASGRSVRSVAIAEKTYYLVNAALRAAMSRNKLE